VIKAVVVDYGMGNIKSVQRGLKKVGAEAIISRDPELFSQADCLVLPGVGAFEAGMRGIVSSGINEALNAFVQSGKPFMGICLGMQMLMESSTEHGVHKGLAYIPGSVQEIPYVENEKCVRKIPHIGWSELLHPVKRGASWDETLLSGIKENDFFYFIHSYMAVPAAEEFLLAQCEYEGLRITAAVKKDNVTGFQFHPEKSGELGLKILHQFVNS